MAKISIIVNSLNKRSGPSTSFGIIGKLSKGSTVSFDEKISKGNERWYKLSDGSYICGYKSSDGWYVKDTPSSIPKQTDVSYKPPNINKSNNNLQSGKGLDSKIQELMKKNINRNVRYIDPNTRALGQPYQFLSSTDYRNADTVGMGRKYLENILVEAPILTIIPGRPNYLPDVTKAERKALTSVFAGKGKSSNDKKAINEILNGSKDIRYFGFTQDYSEYIRYVNILCRACSIYMGVGEQLAPSAIQTKYKNYNWANYKYRDAGRRTNREQNGTFNMTLGNKVKSAVNDMAKELSTPDYVNFYVDSNISFSESSDNSTTQSTLESQFSDSLEGISKELAFYLNAGGAGLADDVKNSMMASINSITNSSMVKKGGMIDRIIGSSTNIIQGSNMTFPELWTDSGYSKSYNVSMTLVSPYGTKSAIYLNLIVPLMHILALALPRQTSANSFTSPFLIKGFAPGWFVCDMGIITSITVEKSEWTVDGLPSEIKINFTIKDLYDNLMIAPSSKPADFFNNQGLMDFLAVTSGLDILKPQFQVKVDTIMQTLVNRVTDVPSNIYQDFMGSFKEVFLDLVKFK